MKSLDFRSRTVLIGFLVLFIIGSTAVLFHEATGTTSEYSAACDELSGYPPEIRDACEELAANVAQKGIERIGEFLTPFTEHRIFEVGDCHIASHGVGRAAAQSGADEAFSAKKIFENLPTNAALCALKSYHGFFYEIFTQKGIAGAPQPPYADNPSAPCRRVSEGVADRLVRFEAEVHCHIGIGYGVAAYFAELYPGNEKVVVEKSLTYCERAERSTKCALGVYEAFAMMYNGLITNHDFALDKNDPFAICRVDAEGRYTESCLIEMRSSVIDYLRGDLSGAGSFLSYFPGELQAVAMESLGIGTASFLIVNGRDTYEPAISACREAPKALQVDCLGGMVWSYARVESTREAALRMCASEQLSETERQHCHKKVYASWKHNYSPSEYVDLCTLFDDSKRINECLRYGEASSS